MLYFVGKYFFFSYTKQPFKTHLRATKNRQSLNWISFYCCLGGLTFLNIKIETVFNVIFDVATEIQFHAMQNKKEEEKKDENKTEVVSIICRAFEYTTMFLFIFFLHRFVFFFIYTWIEYLFILQPFIVYSRIVENISI